MAKAYKDLSFKQKEEIVTRHNSSFKKEKVRQEIQDEFGISRATATRWIKRAKSDTDKKKFKGLTPSEVDSYKWWIEKTDLQKLKKDRGKEEYTKLERRAIRSGSFVNFNYKNPKGKGSKALRWYDENPVIVILWVKGGYMLGLNFHYAPRPARHILIQMILKLNKANIRGDRRLELSWEMIHQFIKRNGLDLMIHKYITRRLTNLQYIKGSEVHKIVSLPSERFVIQDSSISESDLNRMIASSSAKARKSKSGRK